MGRRAYGQGLRGLACALMAWQVWIVWHAAGYEASGMRWSCDTDGCGSDQFAAMAPEVGIASALLLLWCVAGAGAALAAWGAAVSVRRTAGLRRLHGGYASAEARLEGWRAVGRGRGEVAVVFHDLRGARHEVPAVVPRIALERPVLAVHERASPMTCLPHDVRQLLAPYVLLGAVQAGAAYAALVRSVRAVHRESGRAVADLKA